jgi:hypothetical protein
MSQENVEIVTGYLGGILRSLDVYWERPHSFAEALENDDINTPLREVLDRIHPSMRWTNAIGDVYDGKLACARGVDELMQASQAYSLAIDEVTDLGDDHVLAVLRGEMKGRSSGATATVSIFSLLKLSDGLIVRADEYLRRDEAIKAVGLEE